jgi:PleD family two-component response regulator
VPGQLLQAAEDALDRAKAAGKNRVELAKPEPSNAPAFVDA